MLTEIPHDNTSVTSVENQQHSPLVLPSQDSSNVPELPPKPTLEHPQLAAPDLPPRLARPKPEYSMTSRTASILALRQSELYASPGMNMSGDAVACTPVDLESKMATEPENAVWTPIVRDYSDEFLRKNEMPALEEAIVAGIPESLRPLVYLKTMGVRSCMESHSYSSMVKKAKLAHWESSVPKTALADDLAEVLTVYEFCLHESGSPLEADVATRKFVGGVFPVLATLPGLSKPEVLALLSKFGALFTRVSKDEFCYKCNRVLEDTQNDVFVHITKQGVDLSRVYKAILVDFFSLTAPRPVVLAVLDLVVFEGVDFLVRLTAALFGLRSAELLELSNDDLTAVLYSNEFVSSLSIDVVAAATKTEVTVIKYENEFHLMSANAISGNDNELANLKDAHEDLVLRISDMKAKIDTLKKTQAEILAQSDEYTRKLEEAQKEKQALSDRAEELQARYAHLTMKENLNNTIQANRDISSGNADLEAQIADLEAKIAKKKAKLEKLKA